MNKQDFLEQLTEIMQLDETITEDAVLVEYPEWDSMASLGVMSMFDIEYGITLNFDDLKKFNTVHELMVRAGDKITD
ncbi:acyl carrier protein [Shewanella sp. SM32]|uniref:acyl carrier protein n=1 Tax=Shewanella TaxID=22 RepID=UPI0021D801F8|nr:acyl carrier protein [Shewanella sp. SM32]MCU8069529.1 acyl carrier protein [Shewanella sp. SM32]